MRTKTLIIGILLLLAGYLMPAAAQTLSEEATVSLLSCTPGKPLYFHYGHSALRIQDPAYSAPDGTSGPIDWTFNYGLFSFNTSGFYVKFVKGETDYMLGLEHTSDFQLSCAWEDRTIYYQPLVLSQEDKQAILDALLENYKPENRYYRYNFVYDNCATRPWRIIRKALDLPEAEGMSGKTWRENIDYYSGRWTWGKFGINLLFGYEADREMTVEQSLFLPENLMNYVSEQGLSDDEYIGVFVPRNGSFKTSPELVCLLLIGLLLLLTIIDARFKRFTWQADIAFFCLYFILGCIITFLYFFSTHPFVGSNLNVLCINPLWLAAIILCCWKKGREWLLKISPVLFIWMAVVMFYMLFKHQPVHMMYMFVFAHVARLNFIHRAGLIFGKKNPQTK